MSHYIFSRIWDISESDFMQDLKVSLGLFKCQPKDKTKKQTN